MTLAQQRALAILPKVTGGLSCLCSATTAAYVLQSPKKRQKFYHQLILGMSLADISSSIWLAMSTWPIPENSSSILYAIGNKATCQTQGFFTQAGISSPMYNCSLSFFYLFAVKYAWRDSRLTKSMALFHGIPLLWGVATAIASLSLNILHSANLWCWIGPNPNDNTSSIDDINIYRMIFFYGPLWIAILIVSINLILVFAHVRHITLRSEKHNKRSMAPMGLDGSEHFVVVEDDELYHDQGFLTTEQQPQQQEEKQEHQLLQEKNQPMTETTEEQAIESAQIELRTQQGDILQMLSFAKRRREVAFQCLRFAIAFYITWIPISAVRILQMIEMPIPYGLLLLAATMTPLQGLPNFLVYLFPLLQSKLAARRRQKKNSVGLIIPEEIRHC